jgi:hypothetical protein
MTEKVTSEGIISRVVAVGLRHCTLIYANDVVTFMRPIVTKFRAFSSINEDFGTTSRLCTNLNKCSDNLIKFLEADEAMVAQELGCPIMAFPLRYLGLPLILRKPNSCTVAIHGG